jgi:TolB-like protein
VAELLEISLFGTCLARVTGSTATEIRGAKHLALLAMLASAPQGQRTRTYLQNTLWGYAGYDSGHQNLRRALSDLRKQMGPHFEKLIHTTNTDVKLDLTRVRYLGNPGDGPFLGDLNVTERAFMDWVIETRRAPDTILDLFATDKLSRVGRSRPRVTALPLGVIGDDPDLRVLADWVAEETCRSLSRSNLLSVISHLSSRTMAQKMIDIAEVRTTLDIDYLVTGTLRRQGGELIADFDFVDAHSGDILWNRHLACPACSFSEDLQGRLENVIQAIGRSIASSAIRYVRDRPLPQIEDHNLIIAGVSMMHRSPMRDFIQSREYLIEAKNRMPNTAEAHAWLGKWYVLSVFKGFSSDRTDDTQKALGCTARALDLDPENSFGLTIDGFAQNNLLKRMDTAETRYGAALDVNPNESLAWLLRGALMAFQDDGAAAIRATQTARKLSPIDPFGYYYDSLASTAYIAAEDFENALLHADRSLAVNDRHLSTLRTRTTALHFLGRHAEARASVEDLMRRHPSFNIDEYKRNHPSADNKAGQRVIEALSASGMNL